MNNLSEYSKKKRRSHPIRGEYISPYWVDWCVNQLHMLEESSEHRLVLQLGRAENNLTPFSIRYQGWQFDGTFEPLRGSCTRVTIDYGGISVPAILLVVVGGILLVALFAILTSPAVHATWDTLSQVLTMVILAIAFIVFQLIRAAVLAMNRNAYLEELYEMVIVAALQATRDV